METAKVIWKPGRKLLWAKEWDFGEIQVAVMEMAKELKVF